ncbi:hypothetical protein ACW73L_10280 [Methylolobus aquaticus]
MSHVSQAAAFIRTAVRILSGVLIWGGHFLFIYATTAVVCARGWDAERWLGVSLLTGVIGAATVAAGVIAGWMIARAVRSARHQRVSDGSAHFVDWITAALCALALVAIAWETLPLLLLTNCAA